MLEERKFGSLLFVINLFHFNILSIFLIMLLTVSLSRILLLLFVMTWIYLYLETFASLCS
ncbi:hypothetical protein MtrunA17_Chr8g0391381 [Medicago truncatula]|uniref:Transmembrane protein n=1 Tax=Medicago truncatula TaxID=3880 RepID=A0A396GRK5_MEDTR|nr:hypothetical protein MtrunA17_Chr8g0391381 [Medicago truncatula]